tara:strand:+ start:38 stop:205 length:168 start_codon:yes stop_codon:yes gene_type:complete
MRSSITLSPVEDCQLYQKRVIIQKNEGVVRQIQIKTHEKDKKTKNKCKWCGSKGS